MKVILQFVTTVVACIILQTFLPWWTMAIGAGCAGYLFGNKGYLSFFAGFIAVSCLWLAIGFYIDATTQSILTEKMNRLLPANVFLLTGIVGGLIGGLAAMTGSLLKRLV